MIDDIINTNEGRRRSSMKRNTYGIIGAMDSEIQEADLQAEFFDQFRETNFNEQMDKAMTGEV